MSAEPWPQEAGRFRVNGYLPPLQFTTCRWFNRYSRNGKRTKVLAHYGDGVLGTFAYGTHTPVTRKWWDDHRARGERYTLQTANVCTPRAGLGVIDVDELEGHTELGFSGFQGRDREGRYHDIPKEPDKYVPGFLDTCTGQLLGPEHATVIRTQGRFHIYIDLRAVPLADWPPKKPIAGADIITNGFVPRPGSEHYSGDIYQPSRTPLYIVWPWPELIEAIHADQADERPRRQGGGGGHGCGGGSGEPVDIAGLTKTGLPTGGRNNTLLSAACSLFRRYGTAPDGEASVRAELGPVLQRTDTSGFDGDEIDTVIERARQFIVGRELWELEAWKALRAVAR